MSVPKVILYAIGRRFGFWLSFSLLFVVGYYILLLSSLVVRFGHFPNYITPYNWFKNVWVIIQSTPSFTDMLPIIQEEWLLEIGYMNYSFGNGISVWSLNLLPAKMLVVFLIGAFIATNIILLQMRARTCSNKNYGSALTATGLGGILVGLTNATMTWVVCCATPSWVVGLAMLGLGVSTSLWLEPLGTWLALLGFGFLIITTIYLARQLALDETSKIGEGATYA